MNDSVEVFDKTSVPRAVISNVIPAMISMLMVLVYNLADTFFIGKTNDAYMVAASSHFQIRSAMSLVQARKPSIF